MRKGNFYLFFICKRCQQVGESFEKEKQAVNNDVPVCDVKIITLSR